MKSSVCNVRKEPRRSRKPWEVEKKTKALSHGRRFIIALTTSEIESRVNREETKKDANWTHHRDCLEELERVSKPGQRKKNSKFLQVQKTLPIVKIEKKPQSLNSEDLANRKDREETTILEVQNSLEVAGVEEKSQFLKSRTAWKLERSRRNRNSRSFRRAWKSRGSRTVRNSQTSWGTRLFNDSHFTGHVSTAIGCMFLLFHALSGPHEI